MKYKVSVEFMSGNKVEAFIMAQSPAEAFAQVLTSHVVKAGGKLKNIEIEQMKIEPVDGNRFAVIDLEKKPGWFLLVDLDNFFGIEFKGGSFNETNVIRPLIGDKLPDIMRENQTTILREAADFLLKNYKNII